MLDLLREIGQSLRQNRLRTILTGISVSWGVFMLIVLLGIARGMRNSFEERMFSRNTNVISFWGGRTSRPFEGYKSGRAIGLKQSDGHAIERDLGSRVAEVIPFASVDTAYISTVRDRISGGFSAVYPQATVNDGIEITHGRSINDRDIAEARRVMVLPEREARQLFESDSAAVGGTVTCMGLAWTVVGVYTHRWRSSLIYAPYTTYKAVTGNNDDAYQLDVFVDGITDEAASLQAENDIRASLGRVHRFAPDDQSATWSWNRLSNYLSNLEGNKIINWIVWVIGLLTLLTGIVGVSNIMFVSVRERTHEIGVRRAIGAKPRAILGQVLTESVALTAVFGYIGIFVGMVVLQIFNHFQGNSEGFSNPTVDLSIALQVTVALVVAGALAGLFPALKAIKVKPVEALRDE